MRGTCFVIQGFGKKTDFESGRTLDLDASYEVIKDSVTEAGLECVRADEIRQTGPIERVMYERLLCADLVIADISTSNVNAFYELGVRFALRPKATLVVAEDKVNFPFDINHIPITTYEHLGSDIGRREAKRFQKALVELITAIMRDQHNDSPVFSNLPNLVASDPSAAIGERAVSPPGAPALSDLKRQAREAMKRSDFVEAIALWRQIRDKGPKDDYVTQQLALANYKSEAPTEREALDRAKSILEGLWPRESLDPETLGLWAAVHKRIYELDGIPGFLDEAIDATERGFALRRDYYNGINLAYLLDSRAAASASFQQATEDHAHAQGVRRRVKAICQRELESKDDLSSDSRYWVLATLQEAAVGLGDGDAVEWTRRARKAAGADWMLDSTAKQIAKLEELLTTIASKHK